MAEIEMTKAEKECRAAWAAAPDAKYAWCCHHAVRIEQLTEPAENRIDYIISDKPEHEQERRLNNFRPVLTHNPAWVAYDKARAAYDKARAPRDEAWAAYDEAWAAYTKAWAAYNKAWAAHDKARAARDEAWAAYTKALAAYRKAWAAYVISEDCERAHRKDVPQHTWNGKDIF